MSTSDTNLSAEDCHLPMSLQENYFDCNAQFPSPDHVFEETPADMYISLITPSSTSPSKVNVAIQTNVSFPDILPEQMQTALDAYSISPEGNESKNSFSEEKNNLEDCNYFLQQLIETYLSVPLSNVPDDFEFDLEKISSEELMNIMNDKELVELQPFPINLPAQPSVSCDKGCESKKSDEETNNFDDIELVDPQPIPVIPPLPPSADCDGEVGCESKKSDEETYNFDDIELVDPQPISVYLPSPPSSDSDTELGCESKKSDEETNNFDDIELVDPQSISVYLPSPPSSDCDTELGCESEISGSEGVGHDFDDIELVEPQPFIINFPSPPSSDCDSELVDSEDFVEDEPEIYITEPTCHPDNEV